MLNLIKWSVLITEYCAFLVALWTFRKHTLVFRLFFFDLLLVFINETAGLYFFHIRHVKNDLWTYDVYIAVEVWLMGMGGYLLINNKVIKRLIPWVLSLFTGMVLIHALRKGIYEPPIMCLLSGNIILACIFLYVMLQMVNTKAVGREPLLWVCIGLIIYYGCSIPYWGVFNYLLKNNLPMLQKLVMMFWVINIFRYGLTIVGFLLLPKKIKTDILPT